MRHALIVGEACPGTSAAHGRAVGAFLRALHSRRSRRRPSGHGARDAAASYAEAQEIRDRMAVDVLPLLPDGRPRPG